MSEVERLPAEPAHNPQLPAAADAAPAMFGELMSVSDFEKAIADIEKKDKLLDDFMRRVMQKGRHYGEPYPGAKKLTLLKGGAELMDRLFNNMPRPNIDSDHTVEDWERKPVPFFHIVIRTELINRATGRIVGYGYGSCSSTESKYLYRDAKRTCPGCGAETIFKSKKADSPGWFCWAAKGGCGKQFGAADAAIVGQELGKVLNDDVQGLFNTILKMARKRSHMDAVLSTYGLSGMFDVDDDEDDDDGAGAGNGGSHAPAQNGHGGEKKPAQPEDIGPEARKQLFDAFTKSGHKAADVRRWIQEKHGFDMSALGFPKAKFVEILKRLEDKEPLFPPADAPKAAPERSCLCPPDGEHFNDCPQAPQPAAGKRR